MHLEAVAQAHAAAFIGRTPWDVSRDAGLLAAAHRTAWTCYGNRMVTPVIEPQLAEAEAWSACISPESDGDRIVHGAPVFAHLSLLRELRPLDPGAACLATPLAAAGLLAREVRGTVSVPVTGPLATAVILAGRERFLERLAVNPLEVRETLLHIVESMRPWIEAIGRADLAIAIHEADYTPDTLPSAVFASTILPALTELVAMARSATRRGPALIIEGDTAPIAGHICSTNADYVICPATTSRTAFLAQARCFPNVTVQVDLERDLWIRGDWRAICRAIAEIAGVARLHSRTVLGTGPLPLHASSVFVVDACNFAMSMDPWLEPV